MGVTNIILASLIVLVKFRSTLPYSKATRYRHTTQRHTKKNKIANRITATKNIDIHQRKHFQNANTKISWPPAPTVVDGIGMIYHI